MAVNRDKPDRWKSDIALSVDMYNQWFLQFAPEAFRNTRILITRDVEATLSATSNLADLSSELLAQRPEALSTLRMSTCPPLAVDRLIGLSGAPPGLIKSMEKNKSLPATMHPDYVYQELDKVVAVIRRMLDTDIFVWLNRTDPSTESEIHRAATIVADRLCGAVANPIIRNAQEKRQLSKIGDWLKARNYQQIPVGESLAFDAMQPGTFSFHLNVPVRQAGRANSLRLPVDAVVMPVTAKVGDLPIFIEAKSAGDFANVNKRRKEEAMKITLLKSTYGPQVKYILFLCGYFDSGYLGYEAAEGIDWVWEHRIDDLSEYGL